MTANDNFAAGAADGLLDTADWVFDLDNTLYPVSASIFDQVDRRMCLYIAELLNLDTADAYKLQKSFFREHGTTLKGLMDVHNIDPAPYLDFVHEVDVTPIPPDDRLDRALGRLKGRKIIYTNATAGYARRVLDRIGVSHHFDAIFDIIDAGYVPKPDPAPYRRIVERLGIDISSAVMVEDIARNLIPARDLGMTTVWVRTDRPWASSDLERITPDHATDSLTDWLAALTA